MASFLDPTKSHHRRRSSGQALHLNTDLNSHNATNANGGRTSFSSSNDQAVAGAGAVAAELTIPERSTGNTQSRHYNHHAAFQSNLSPIAGSPTTYLPTPMSLSRTPSPRPGGGWSSPGLSAGSSDASSPSKRSAYLDNSDSSASWAAAKEKSDAVRNYPSFSTRNNGFFSRSKRKISASLPHFSLQAMNPDYREKEKMRGPWSPYQDASLMGRIRTMMATVLRRMKSRFLVVLLLVLGLVLFYGTRE